MPSQLIPHSLRVSRLKPETRLELDRILRNTGSGKAGLLQATVYLSDVKQKQAVDPIWIDWIGPEENWPQRACVGVDLDEGCLIEVVVTAKTL